MPTQTRRDLICIDRTSFNFFHVAVRNPQQHLAETIDGNVPRVQVQAGFFVQTAVNALRHGPLDLSLARGPARN
jgi:hypothetical protein